MERITQKLLSKEEFLELVKKFDELGAHKTPWTDLLESSLECGVLLSDLTVYKVRTPSELAVQMTLRDMGGTTTTLFRAQIGEVLVSTVFLGHSYASTVTGLQYFETMIFDHEGRDVYQERTETYVEAERQHERALEWLKEMMSGTPELLTDPDPYIRDLAKYFKDNEDLQDALQDD